MQPFPERRALRAGLPDPRAHPEPVLLERSDDVRLRFDGPRRLRPHSGEPHDESFPVLLGPVLEVSGSVSATS